MADAIITRRGGNQGENKPLDLPISIQLTQPTPVRVGHLWIKADIASRVANIVIDRALKASVSDGTIQLIVPLDPHKLNISQSIAISENKDVPISLSTAYSASKWALNNLLENGNVVQILLDNYPIIYSKLNGVLDIETSFIWDGTSWVNICTKGKYLLAGNDIYNILVNDTVYNKVFTMSEAAVGSAITQISPDGMYALSGNCYNDPTFRIYARSGDTFTKIWTAYYSPWACSLGSLTIRWIKLCRSGRVIMMCDTGTGCALLFYNIVNNALVEVDAVSCPRKLRDMWQLKSFIVSDDEDRIAFTVTSDNTYTGSSGGQNYVQIVKKGGDGKYALAGTIKNGWNESRPNFSVASCEGGLFIDDKFMAGFGTYPVYGNFDIVQLYTVASNSQPIILNGIKISDRHYLGVNNTGATTLIYFNKITGTNGTITVAGLPAGVAFWGVFTGKLTLDGFLYCNVWCQGPDYAAKLRVTIVNDIPVVTYITAPFPLTGGATNLLTASAVPSL